MPRPPTQLIGLLMSTLMVTIPAVSCTRSEAGRADTGTTTTATTTTTTTTTRAPDTAERPEGRSSSTEGSLTTPDGRRRSYIVHRPEPIRPDRPLPLVIALHGGLGSAQGFDTNAGWANAAADAGAVVVLPQGTGPVGAPDRARTWNAGLCCGAAVNQQVDDVGFLRRLVEGLAIELPIDRSRIAIVGHSNGGFMAMRMACEAADIVTAVAIQAGGIGVETCRPGAPVSVLHLHGLNDRNVPLEGGRGSGLANIAFPAVRPALAALATNQGCTGEPERERRPDDNDIESLVWPCPSGVEIRLTLVEGASHAWMGHAATAPRLTGEASMALDATATTLGFVLAHPRG